MTASKILLYFCLSFISGVFLSSYLRLPYFLITGILFLAGFLIFIFRPSKKLIFTGFFILFFISGVYLQQSADFKIANNELAKYNDRKKLVLVEGTVESEPMVGGKSLRMIINNLNIKSAEGYFLPTEGKILLNAGTYPEYRYGDKLKISGKLKNPEQDIDGFNYKNYLAKDGIYSIMDFPKIESTGENSGNAIVKFLLSFKNKFEETAASYISPPQEGLLEALFFGDENNISKEWKDKLNYTGTRHIAAVSGMNITIISSLIISFLLSCGFWRKQALFLSIFIIFLYILMIGAPSSAVRAGIMAVILIIAQGLGRLSSASRAIVFAAALMLIQNPLILKLDVGFQLSFLATLGMIHFQTFFGELLKALPDPSYFPLKTTLSTTISAQVFTFPILIYNFGYFSLLSIFTNILIVPFLAPLTILIFIFGLSGMFFGLAGYLLSFPVWLFLSYILTVIDWFSKLSFISLKLENVHWLWLLASYLLLSLMAWQINKKQKLKFLRY